MEQSTINVQGMSCGHCVKAIEGSVGGLTGVTSVQVSLDNGTVDVIFDTSKVNLAAIKDEIEEQGYDL